MWLVEARGRVDAELESQMAVTSESALMPKGTLDDDAHGGQATGVCSARLLLSSNSLKHDDIRILMGRSVRAHFSTQNECDNLRLALQSALTQSRVCLQLPFHRRSLVTLRFIFLRWRSMPMRG